MPKTKPPEVRRLERLFAEKFIPWAQNAAPLVLLDNPPRSSVSIPLKERMTGPLLDIKRHNHSYPEVRHWVEQRLNTLSVPLLGCIFEGDAHYRTHTPPGVEGCEWTIGIPSGSLFAIAPNTPFSDGSKVAWELPGSPPGNISGILWRLQRDGVGCLTFTCQNDKIWLHPYVFLYQTEAAVLGDKLLAEMRLLPVALPSPFPQEAPATPVVPSVEQPVPDNHLAVLYWQLILRLLQRTISQGEYSVLHSGQSSLHPVEYQFPSLRLPPGQLTRVASDYINSSLDDVTLTSSLVAQRVGLSERHLNRLFAAETGLSIHQYLQQQRGEKACDLLSHQGIPIQYIATYCGFSQASAFSTWFSKRYNCTPREYRSKTLGKMSEKSN